MAQLLTVESKRLSKQAGFALFSTAKVGESGASRTSSRVKKDADAEPKEWAGGHHCRDHSSKAFYEANSGFERYLDSVVKWAT